MKCWVLFYNTKSRTDTTIVELNHYKVFLYKKDLAQFLMKQDNNFFTIAIRKMNLSKSTILDKNYQEINLIMSKAKKGEKN